MIPKLAVLLGGCLLGLSGCELLFPAKVELRRLVPAQAAEAAAIRQVAVLPFNARPGDDPTAQVEAILASVRVDDTPFFRLAERERVAAILKEIRFSQSGAVTASQALKLGKVLGVRGLYTGAAESPTFDRTTRQANDTECIDDKCKQTRAISVTCNITVAAYSFTPKLIDVETGEIVFASTIKGTASGDSCGENLYVYDKNYVAPTESQLLERARTQAFDSFRQMIAPYYAPFTVELLTSREGLSDPAMQSKLSQGVSFATAGRMDRGCEIWSEMEGQAASAPAVLYNLGVCAEMRGEMNVAETYHKRADKLFQKPDRRVSAALERVAQSRNDQLKLNKQMTKPATR